MSTASIIFLIVLFGGFIIVVILIFKNRKKLRGKMDTSPYLFNDVFTPDDIPTDNLHDFTDHGSGGDGGDH
jgi:hypothetical protein